MAISKSLKKFLSERKVKVETKKHKEVYTAQEIAGKTHTPGSEFAKVVVAKAKEGFFLAVLPASYRVDLVKLKSAVGSAGPIKIATESEFKTLFPDCEVGAMPPFGGLYNLPTIVDKSFSDDEKIAFNAGTHKELMKMKFSDYKSLESPRISSFAFNPDLK
jgi:Ala-tRNA(Pro) deacylase